MNKLNWLLTLSSLSVLLVTIERFSFTTRILLQPYNFLRLHEIVQMCVVILFTVIIPYLVLKEVSDNFSLLRKRWGFWLGLMFVTGIYFYATGNGVHEVSSFNFNNFCDTKNFQGNLCGGMFFNDYYTGNILYFVGGILMYLSLLLFEQRNPNKTYQRKDLPLTTINSLIFSFAIFAYSGFDRVLVGLVFSLIMMTISLILLYKKRGKILEAPYTLYTVLSYSVGTIAALAVRIF
ncbi:hypothetical protein HY345_02895 [Candidatus Microgenomates bacterium]|nr:hypothetical protein [Candidatus Microgenomates bacterium]